MEKQINLLHVTQYLAAGGLENLIVQLSQSMQCSKFNIQVLCLNSFDPYFKNKLTTHGIKVHFINKRHKFDLSFMFRFSSFLRKEKIDIIHVHGGCYFYAAICGKLARVNKIIYTAHGMPIMNGLQISIEDTIFSIFVDRIVAVSEEIRNDFRSRWPFFRNKITLIINGVNTEVFKPNYNAAEIKAIKKRFNIPEKKIIIGTVGRLAKEKNYSMLIRAFNKCVTKNGSIAHLVFVGDGRQSHDLKELVTTLGLCPQVSFLGLQYDINNILPAMDVFALSSITEGTSISLLEAQACGIPAVVTNIGGNSNIIKHGYNGFLCDLDDYSDMARKFNMIIRDRELAKQMHFNALKTISTRFTFSTMANAYEELYLNLIASKNNYYPA